MATTLVLAAQYYQNITDMLYDGIKQEFIHHGYTLGKNLNVSGVLELPMALNMALDARKRGKLKFDLAVAIGCVIRGETGHYDVVVHNSIPQLQKLVLDNNLPFGFGILTVENMEQAVARADPVQLNKGKEAAAAAVQLHNLQCYLI